MDNTKCRLCGKENHEHTEKMHTFQTIQYPVNLPPHILIAKNQLKKKEPIPKSFCVSDGMAERETFAPEPAAETTEAAELPEAEVEETTLEPEPEETFDGVIVAFHPETSSGFIRKLNGGKGSGFFFGAEDVITSGELRIGTKVRFKTVQQTFKETSQSNNTAFKAVDIAINQ
jgi:hypothetical protein